jgi:hypothetical protein
VIEAETPQLRLLLDECVSRRLVVSLSMRKNFDIVHTVDIAGLGWGAQDEDIMQYAVQTGRIVITQDTDFLHECLRRNVAVAYYYAGRVTFYDDLPDLRLGRHYNLKKEHVHTGSPILHLAKYRLGGVYLGLRKRYRVHILQPSQKITRPIVKQCKRPFREYLKCRRKAKLLKASKCKVCGVHCRDTQRLRNHMIHDHYGLSCA